jgi:cytochrome c-type biogenesis protein
MIDKEVTKVHRNPFLTTYLYGPLLGPMTLPCAGPIVLSAFLLGAGSFTQLANSMLYFIAFGIGCGWLLALLPLLARRFNASSHSGQPVTIV